MGALSLSTRLHVGLPVGAALPRCWAAPREASLKPVQAGTSVFIWVMTLDANGHEAWSKATANLPRVVQRPRTYLASRLRNRKKPHHKRERERESSCMALCLPKCTATTEGRLALPATRSQRHGSDGRRDPGTAAAAGALTWRGGVARTPHPRRGSDAASLRPLGLPRTACHDDA